MPADLTNFQPLSRNILAFFGLDLRLPDGSSIRAVHYPQVETDIDEYGSGTHEVYPLVMRDIGTLAEGQYVRIFAELYYVASVAPLKLGWHCATLQAAEARDELLVVDGAYLGVVDGDELTVRV